MDSPRLPRRTLLLTGLLTGALASCSGDTAEPGRVPTPSRSPSPPGKPPGGSVRLVSLHVSGGYAGVDKQIDVRTDGTYTTSLRGDPRGTGRFDGPELSRLRRLLDAARLERQPPRGVDPSLRDQFLYRVAYRDHVVVTDLSSAAGPLTDTVRLLERALNKAVGS